MTKYLNPTNQSKEEWLEMNGARDNVSIAPPAHWIKEGEKLCVWVHNWEFTACVLIENERDFHDFQSKEDTRPKIWIWIPEASAEAFK